MRDIGCRTAIVGCRDWPDLELVESWMVTCLAVHDEVVSGDGGNVDKFAVKYWDSLGRKWKVFEAEWAKYGKPAGPKRNFQIANYCDEMVAFWDRKSRGTASAIRHALNLMKPVEVVFLDGTFTRENDDIREMVGLERRVPKGFVFDSDPEAGAPEPGVSGRRWKA